MNIFQKPFLHLRRGIHSLLEPDCGQISQVLLSQCHEVQPLWYRFLSTGVWQQTGLRKWSPYVLSETRFGTRWAGFGEASHVALRDKHTIWISTMEWTFLYPWYNSSLYSVLVPMAHRADIFYNEMRCHFTNHWKTEWEILFNKLDWEVLKNIKLNPIWK